MGDSLGHRARPAEGCLGLSRSSPAWRDVESAISGVPRANLQLTGWPTRVAPTRPRGAASVMKLYFLGQSRSFHASCDPVRRARRVPVLSTPSSLGTVPPAHSPF